MAVCTKWSACYLLLLSYYRSDKQNVWSDYVPVISFMLNSCKNVNKLIPCPKIKLKIASYWQRIVGQRTDWLVRKNTHSLIPDNGVVTWTDCFNRACHTGGNYWNCYLGTLSPTPNSLIRVGVMVRIYGYPIFDGRFTARSRDDLKPRDSGLGFSKRCEIWQASRQ